ncbi:MAG: hypothetical protein LBC40_03715 [Dysgonamonadaceae bacterium]|jgi:hypothetical protein|nr:hypothetical protein [Dysgonamonadaceae bacterium]
MYSSNKERIKELRGWAKEHLQQKSLLHEGFGREIHFTGAGIKEYLNQPHKFFSQKNELIKEMDSVLKDSIYKGQTSYRKGNANIVASHIFEIKINDEKSWIIVRESANGDTNFYSISDSSKVLQGIKKIIAQTA